MGAIPSARRLLAALKNRSFAGQHWPGLRKQFSDAPLPAQIAAVAASVSAWIAARVKSCEAESRMPMKLAPRPYSTAGQKVFRADARPDMSAAGCRVSDMWMERANGIREWNAHIERSNRTRGLSPGKLSMVSSRCCSACRRICLPHARRGSCCCARGWRAVWNRNQRCHGRRLRVAASPTTAAPGLAVICLANRGAAKQGRCRG